MLKKKLLLNFFIIILTLQVIPFSQARNVSTSQYFDLYFTSGSSLGFQHDNDYVFLSIASGNLNSSTATLIMFADSGMLRFTSNESCSFNVVYNIESVKVEGDNGNAHRAVGNNSLISVISNDNVFISWNRITTIWFPLSFIMGIVGLISLFGGSLYGVHLLKKEEYSEGLKFSAIWIALGITLVIAWLFA